ncbi:MAG: DinB family protein [Bacteroidetes bacterium]|nr:DinB family protein [Bacteroidota bacterium]
MSVRAEILCDILDNQRRLTKWYLKRIPENQFTTRVEANGRFLNSPAWVIAHLIWTDYTVGLLPLGFKGEIPSFTKKTGFGSTGDLPENLPPREELISLLNSTHQLKLDFLQKLDDATLDGDFSITSLGFRNNYYALLHLARHEGVHCGNIAAICKLNGIKTV